MAKRLDSPTRTPRRPSRTSSAEGRGVQMPVEGNRRRWLAYAVLLAGIGWIGWQIIGNTIADTRATTDPQLALWWRPDLPAALVALSEQKLQAGKTDEDLVDVSNLAKQAMVASPIAAGALHMAALAEDGKGNGAKARLLMNLANRQSLRDTVAEAWLFDHDLADGQFPSALAIADAMLRTRPDLAGKLFPALAKIAAEPAGMKALVNLLVTDPPWRAQLLSALPRLADQSVAYGVLTGLGSTALGVRPSETKPYIDQLVRIGQIQSGYFAWLHFLSPQQSRAVSYLYNGDFEQPLGGTAFDWLVSEIHGAETEIVDTGDREHGHAVRVTFANTRVAYRNLSKLLVLPPGHYQLSGLVKADHLENDRGMAWQLSCADGDKRTIAETNRVSGTHGWQSFATTFEVPDTGCYAQWLTLELAARVALEQQVGGEVWYDDLAVKREQGTIASGAAGD